MQVENKTSDGAIQPSNVQTALFFETPEELFARVFRQFRPRTPLPRIRVEFRQFAGANSSIQLRDGQLHVRISDLLQGAPAPVAEALANILISKLFRKSIPPIYHHRYRLWLNRRDVRRTLHLVRQSRGRKLTSHPKGKYFDLEAIFDELNSKFFHGMLARPTLGWSLRSSRTRLGHYDPSHNTIVLSRIFDRPNVPRIAIDYVMHHEMLHLLHPEESCGSRRRIHTPQFQAAEKQFPHLGEAKKVLKEVLRAAQFAY